MATRRQASQYFMAEKKQQRKPQTAQAHEFYIYAGAYRLLIYGSFNKGILGLEKSRKRHPNSFKTRHIAIKPPTTLLSSLLSPPHPSPPPSTKKEKQLTTTKSARLKNSTAILLCKVFESSKLKHTAGKTLKRSSKDFSLFGKSLESLLPSKGRWHPSLPAFTFKLLLTVQPFFGYETSLLLVSKDQCKSILNSYLYKTGSKQLYESREWPSEV